MYAETHTHLADEQFDGDRDDVFARARDVGVKLFVEIGEDEPQWDKARGLAETHSDVYWTAGLHPYYAVTVNEGLLSRIEQAIHHPRCVAVGEIGLDYHRDDSPRDVQRRALQELLDVAKKGNKPVVLHCREAKPVQTEAQRDLLDVLKTVDSRKPDDPPAGVAHCFQGTEETAKTLIALGYMIGVDGPITYPGAGALRALLSALPLDSLVLETDSPYLPPQAFRGKRNDPSHIPAIARALAELKGMSLDVVATTTTANANRLYRLPHSK